MKQRAMFATKMGVIAATVGSAVGLGNIWKFPYETGAHGGGAFLLIYIGCVFLVGIPVMISEFIIGRSTHQNARSALRTLAPGKKGVTILSYMGILASLMILSFYAVVAGWIVEYLFQSISGNLSGYSVEGYSNMFTEFTSSPGKSLTWTLLFLVLNYLILRKGVQKGIERISNIMMPILFLLLIVFCINSLLLPNSWEGIKFLFYPDMSKVTSKMVIGAMGQAFFSLSLGLSCLLTYSSYFSDKTPLVRSATIIAVLDTLVAILAGIIIFPAVFSFGLEPAAGPKLVFEILPNIFQQMPGGYFWSAAFFILLFFASITSTISMSEISITFFTEEYKMSRKKATILNTAIAMLFGSLCALSFNVLKDAKLLDLTIFDMFEYISSNILLPLGGLGFALFVGWYIDKRIINEQLTNFGERSIALIRPIIFCIRYVAPIGIAIIFLYGLGYLDFIL